jgi:hypothetical protein
LFALLNPVFSVFTITCTAIPGNSFATSVERNQATLSSEEALSTTTMSYATEGGDWAMLLKQLRNSSPPFQLTIMIDNSIPNSAPLPEFYRTRVLQSLRVYAALKYGCSFEICRRAAAHCCKNNPLK